MTHSPSSMNHLSTFEQTHQQILVNILTDQQLPFPVSLALLEQTKSSNASSGDLQTPPPNAPPRKLPAPVRQQIQVLLYLDYFQHSLLYHLIKHDKKHVLVDWLKNIFQMVRDGHFQTCGVSDRSSTENDNLKRVEYILQECFCVLPSKTWSQDVIKLMHENGKNIFKWGTEDYRKMRADGKNAMHHACWGQNLALVRWLSKVVGLSLTYPDSDNRNGFDLWLNSERTPNTLTKEFIMYAVSAGYSVTVIRKTVQDIQLLKLQENMKKFLQSSAAGHK